MERTDAELLAAWRAGDVGAGEALFDRYYHAVERFFMNKVSAGVGDLVQETFGRCHEAQGRIEDGDRFRSYLFSIAFNLVRNHYRDRDRARRRGEAVDIDIDAVPVFELARGPSSAVAKRREERLLLEGLRRIPFADQVVLELHYWEDLTTAEMAAVLGRPQGTIKGQIQRARTRLEAAMTAIAESPEVLASTLSDLDGWASACVRQARDDGALS